MASEGEKAELIALYNILKGILQNDNVIRKNAENSLKACLTTPQKLLLSLAKLMQHSSEGFIRNLASVLFKHFISTKSVKDAWKVFTPTAQQEIKNELLAALKNEADVKVAKHMCQSVAELATIIFDEGKDWPELDQTILAFMSGTESYKELAFSALEVLWGSNAERYFEHLGEVCGILETGLKSQSIGVVLEAVAALCTLVSALDSGSAKQLYKYAEEVVKVVNVAGNSGDEAVILKVLDSVSEVTESEPTFFRRAFPQLCEVMLKIAGKKDYINDKLRQMPLENLVTILERMPGIVKKNKTHLWYICSAVFEVMISIDEEVDESWLRPKEGYNTEEDANPDDNVNFGIITYDRLLDALGEDKMFPIIEKVLETSLSSSDWRYRHAGLMSVAQIGEYALDPDKVKNVVPILINHLSHPHPKVRFASLYAIGLLSDDMAPDFQSAYEKIVVSPLLGAVDDGVPRVQAHACAALTNFLEHVSQDIAVQVAPILLPKLVKMVGEGASIVKENAMTCIASISESAGEKFVPYYRELFDFVFRCIKELAIKEYSKLKGQAIECLTIMSASVGKSNFVPYAHLVIELLKEIQEKELTKEDPQRFYLLGAWQRIALILGKDMGPYLTEIVPKVLQIAGSTPTITTAESLESVLGGLSEEKSSKVEVTTAEIDEKEMALEMIAVFAAQLEETYAPFVEESARIVIPALGFHANSELRRCAAGVLPSLMKCVTKEDREKLVRVGRAFLSELLQAHEKELKAEIKGAEILAMKQIIDCLGHFMNLDEVDGMIKKIFEFMKESNDRRNVLLSTKDTLVEDEEIQEGEEDECDAQYEDNAESEEIYQKNITYLLGAIINSHKNESLKHVSKIIEAIIQPNLKGNANQQKAALFAVDDLLDFLGYEKLGTTLWRSLAEIVARYVGNPEHMLRQAACYGMGCLAKNGKEAFQEIALNCLQMLATAVEIKEDKKRRLLWSGARDAAVAAIGKILRYQGNVIPFQDVWGRWLGYLPIKEDEEEAREIHDFVAECALKSPEIAIGGKGERLKELIKVFVKVYPTTLASKETKQKISMAIKQLGSNPNIAPLLNEIHSKELKEEDKKVLEEIAK